VQLSEIKEERTRKIRQKQQFFWPFFLSKEDCSISPNNNFTPFAGNSLFRPNFIKKTSENTAYS